MQLLEQCQDYLEKLGLSLVATDATHLTQGVNNTCFRVKTQCGETLLLKHFDRNNNFNITLVERNLANLKVVPNVIAVNEAYNLIAYQFIETIRFDSKNHLPQLITKLRQLHNLQVSYAFEYIDIAALFNEYSELTAYQEYQHKINHLLAKLASYKREQGVCHNDLVRENLLFSNNDSWLIDFEYVGLNDIYFDLAALCSSLAFTHTEKQHLLKCYFQVHDVSQHQLEKLDAYQHIYNLICYFWYIKHGFTSHAQGLLTLIKN